MKTKIAFEDLDIPTADIYKITNGVAELLSNYNSRYSETILAFFSESSCWKQHREHKLPEHWRHFQERN